jgi:hypothetical protein
VPRRGRNPRREALAIIVAGWVIAMLVVHHPMIFSRLHVMQFDEGDTRFNNYLLEHSYQWLKGSPLHKSLWDLPIFYPQRNTFAYSDVMVSFAPAYWFWRVVVRQPDTAFQFWMFTATTLNFGLMVYLLRRLLKLSTLAATCGGVLFAAAEMRTCQIGHQQLYCQVYVMLALIAVFKLFSPAARSRLAAAGWISLLVGSMVLQLWGGFYIGFFMVLLGIVMAMWAVALRGTRAKLLAVVWRNKIAVMAALLAAAAVLYPLVGHYLVTYQENPERQFENVQPMLPQPQAWLFMGWRNTCYYWLKFYGLFWHMPAKHEKILGLGFVTLAAAGTGLVLNWRKPSALLLLLMAISIVGLTTLFMDRYTLWYLVYHAVPGAKAIRAVARLGVFLLIPASFGFAWCIAAVERKAAWLAVLLAAVCIFEQVEIADPWSQYDKYAARNRVAALAAAVPRDAVASYASSSEDRPDALAQMDAVWAVENCGVPTINGYSGTTPRGYELGHDAKIVTAGDMEQLRGELQGWVKEKGLDGRKIVWLLDGKGMEMQGRR